MPRLKYLIPSLVGLVLILNGISGAVASGQLHSRTSAAHSVATLGNDGGAVRESGCPEHEGGRTSDYLINDFGAKPLRESNLGNSDCCEGSSCDCGCAHQSQVVLTAAFLVTPAIAPASVQLEQFVPPLSPSLSRPVRPPIA